MIGSGDDGDGKRQGCLDCEDGGDQAGVIGFEQGNDAQVLLLNHPLALSDLKRILAAISNPPVSSSANIPSASKHNKITAL